MEGLKVLGQQQKEYSHINAGLNIKKQEKKIVKKRKRVLLFNK